MIPIIPGIINQPGPLKPNAAINDPIPPTIPPRLESFSPRVAFGWYASIPPIVPWPLFGSTYV